MHGPTASRAGGAPPTSGDTSGRPSAASPRRGSARFSVQRRWTGPAAPPRFPRRGPARRRARRRRRGRGPRRPRGPRRSGRRRPRARAPEPRAARDVQQGRVLRGVQGLPLPPLLGWRTAVAPRAGTPARPPLVGLVGARSRRSHDALQGLVERGQAPPPDHVVELAPPQIEAGSAARGAASRHPAANGLPLDAAGRSSSCAAPRRGLHDIQSRRSVRPVDGLGRLGRRRAPRGGRRPRVRRSTVQRVQQRGYSRGQDRAPPQPSRSDATAARARALERRARRQAPRRSCAASTARRASPPNPGRRSRPRPQLRGAPPPPPLRGGRAPRAWRPRARRVQRARGERRHARAPARPSRRPRHRRRRRCTSGGAPGVAAGARGPWPRRAPPCRHPRPPGAGATAPNWRHRCATATRGAGARGAGPGTRARRRRRPGGGSAAAAARGAGARPSRSARYGATSTRPSGPTPFVPTRRSRGGRPFFARTQPSEMNPDASVGGRVVSARSPRRGGRRPRRRRPRPSRPPQRRRRRPPPPPRDTHGGARAALDVRPPTAGRPRRRRPRARRRTRPSSFCSGTARPSAPPPRPAPRPAPSQKTVVRAVPARGEGPRLRRARVGGVAPHRAVHRQRRREGTHAARARRRGPETPGPGPPW